MTQIRTPKCNPGPQICTEMQTKSTWSSFSGLLGDRIQLCNKSTTSTKEGRETWADKIAQTERHEYIRRPNIVKTCFTCRRYTVKSHAWENQQHACCSTFCVQGVASTRPRRASKRLDCRLREYETSFINITERRDCNDHVKVW